MASEIKIFRVESHGFRYGSQQPEVRWFDSYEAALADVKLRLGEQRFHPDARGNQPDYTPVDVQHDGVAWKRIMSRRFSEMPQSSGKQGEFGHVLLEELRRPAPPSPPLVSPFANRQP